MTQDWQHIRNGSRESFLALYDRLYDALFRYAVVIAKDRALAKESIHLLFCELWEGRERLPETVDDPKFYLFTWLKRIILRQLKEQRIAQLVGFEEPVEDSREEQQIAMEQALELQQKLQAAMARLTKKQQRYIDLKFFQEKSYEEIALQENAALRTVYNVIYEAVKSLKGQILLLLLFCVKFF